MKPPDTLEGMTIEVRWPLTQATLDQFGALSGDDHPIHINEKAARAAGLDGTIVQGTLLVGLMGNASTRFFEKLGRPGLSVGYDRLRFIKPLRTGQTVVVNYRIATHDLATGRLSASVEVLDEAGIPVAVATHLSKVV